MQTIKKKTWPDLFEKILNGEKTYEFRLADFNIEPGDKLILEEWDPKTKEYTGRKIEKIAGHVGKIDLDNYAYWTKEEAEKYGYYIISLK